MSRLLKRVPTALIRGLSAWLLTLGLGMPLLIAAGQSFLLGRYALICLGVAAFCAALSTRRLLLPIGLLAAAASQAVLLIFGQGFFHQSLQLLRALVLLIQDTPLALSLHGDALCMQLAVLLTLFCFSMCSPDIDVALPVTIVAGLLGGEWMAGMRPESLYMLPVLPGLLLIYAHTQSYESTPDIRAARPSLWTVPLAAALLALAWIIAPQEGTKSEPLANMAAQLREAINDRFFFQQERSRYTLAADGWMPLGEHRLGGSPAPSDRLVLLAETQEPIYLRGAILDAYTGHYWYDSVSSRRYYWHSPLQRATRDRVFEAEYPLESELPMKQFSVQFSSLGASTLFVPQRLRELTEGEHMTPYFNLGSELFITRNLVSGDRYSGAYAAINANNSQISALADRLDTLDDPEYQSQRDRYSALPSGIQTEVRAIAASVTAGCATDWQKAAAIQDYLRTSFPYSLEVQDPPQDADFVSWFLVVEKKGYCTYFASAMTVLCRLAGLPARYVEGYLAKPNESGVAEVRGINAHAWTEVYLKGLGWVTFDPTPGWNTAAAGSSSGAGSQGPTPTPSPQQQETPTPAPSAAPSDTPTPQPSPEPDAANSPEEQPPTPTPSPTPEPEEPPEEPKKPGHPLLLILLLLLLALVALLALRIRSTEPLRHAARIRESGDALLLLWRSALQCAACLGAPIRGDETPIDYAARAGAALGISLDAPARAVSALRYGRRAPRAAALRAARDAYAQLHGRLRPHQRAALALKRAFTWHRHTGKA